jgi:GDP-L-fucose synthase
MDRSARVFVAGHQGLVGSAIVRRLRDAGYANLLCATRDELDLCRQAEVETWFARQRPDYVFLAAARVGGILANADFPADFIRDNLLIETHVIDAAYREGCRKLLFLGSSCIYPRLARQPISEDSLLTGTLEQTNEPYAIAKIAGIRMAQAYSRQFGFPTVSLMPTNLYGPQDNFDLQSSHVLPALLRRFHEAKASNAPSVTLWGSGTPRREFLHVDDLADAAVFLMQEHDDPEILNIGTGKDIEIRELAELIREIVGYEGRIEWDTTKPDGTPRKLLDVSRIHALGWRSQTGLREGISSTYEWFCDRSRKS